MQPDAERFLEARFEDLRRQQRHFGQGQPMRPAEAAEFVFGIMLTSLRAVGALSDREDSAWRTRVRQQLGSDRERAGQTMAVQRHTQEVPDAAETEPIARFKRMLPVAGGETDVGFGGRPQILGIELYDIQVGVLWRLAPLPDPEAKYADELAAHDREAEGLDERERERARRRFLLRLSLGGGITPQTRRPPGAIAGLADDVGTTYQFRGGGSHGGPVERVGRVLVAPAPPDQATELTISWEGQPICAVPLSDR